VQLGEGDVGGCGERGELVISAGSTPSWNTSNARFAATRMPWGRTTIAGYGR
jgi:hypothetical protein